MADPLLLLDERFRAAIASAFGDAATGADPVVRASDRADYQANGAMGLAKAMGANPREVAAKLLEHLDLAGVASAVEIAGPGFVNVTLEPGFVGAAVAEMAADDRLAVARTAPETVVVDYSAPNVAKEMHVGHLRSTIIGDALVRVLRFLGHDVIRQNHVGDWGTPFGMLIEHLLDLGLGADDLSIEDLNAFYQAARTKFDGDATFAERARERVVLLQAGDDETLRLWRSLVAESARHFNEVYARLGVLLTDDDLAGESRYNDVLDDVAADLEARGVARVDEGALCAFPPGFTNRDGEPLPLIVRKTDGGYGYAATDLAAVRHRAVELGATRIVYVVGAPQREHLAMVFATATTAGWLRPPARAEHVAFGSVLGDDRRMFKTRSGETIRLVDLLDEAVGRAEAVVADKDPDLDGASRSAVARAVGIGAVKYADLVNDRVKDYVFSFERMLAMDGNTAPYLQYAVARIRSIFRRAETDGEPGGDAARILIAEPAERALALRLLSFESAVRATADSLQPHRLCQYLFELATAFTTFYESCPVLRAPSADVRASRLVLCDVTARTLATGLDLLGIDTPERM